MQKSKNNAYNPKEKGPLFARSISQTGAFNYTRFYFPLTNRLCSTYTFAYIAVLDEPIEWNDEMVRVVLLSSPGSQDSKNRQKFYEITAKFALDHDAVEALINDPQFPKFIELLGI